MLTCVRLIEVPPSKQLCFDWFFHLCLSESAYGFDTICVRSTPSSLIIKTQLKEMTP